MSDSSLPSAAPGTRPRPWLGWLLLGVALVVAAAAAVVISLLWERADECRRVQTELAFLRADADELDSLQWEMVSREKLGTEMFQEMEKIQTRMHERVNRLELLASNLPRLGEFTKKYQLYVRVVDQEFKLLTVGNIKEAGQFDVNTEDPAFDALQTALEETGNAYDKKAMRTLSLVRAGIFLVLISGVGIIVLLVWQFNQERHKLEVAAALQRTLNQANEQLESRVRERTADLSSLNKQMEHRIAERTSELQQTNDTLQREIVEHKRSKEELQAAFDKINTLKGLLPICASCKRIRDDKGEWADVETYVQNRTEAHFTHGLCPDCAAKLYPDIPLL